MNRHPSPWRVLPPNFWLAAGLCSAVLMVAGCSMPISVKYSPLAATESIVTGSAKPRAYVVRFTDARAKKDRIGAMKDVWGTTKKNLVTTDDFGLILAEATTDALRKAGLEADLHSDRVPTDSIPPGELGGIDYVIGGRMTDVDVTSHVGWDTISIEAHVVIDVYVRRGDSPQWIGPIEGAAERRELSFTNTEALSSALDTAIQNCMRNMIRHLKSSGAIRPTAGK